MDDVSHVIARPATIRDAALLRRLAEANPPLDVHTPYTYWAMCHIGQESTFVAERGDEPVGFVAAVPSRGGRAFLVWQVCVDAGLRRQGVGGLLLDAVLDAARRHGVGFVEVSIEPTNAASLALFTSRLALTKAGTVILEGESVYEDVYEAVVPSV